MRVSAFRKSRCAICRLVAQCVDPQIALRDLQIAQIRSLRLTHISDEPGAILFYLPGVREARGAILNPGEQISKAEAEFMPPGVQY